ncbi:MAG: hypothetical protein J6V66_03920 [Clostridia bacterium]|nr:hypothetical protein [Clostridia bacterium]
MNLEYEYLEEYKSLDKLCKDMFSTGEGVSEYIRQMDLVPFSNRSYVSNWQAQYKMIVHLRFIRNTIAHDTNSANMEICKEGDLVNLKEFHQSIISGEDPLAVINRATARFNQKAPTKQVGNDKKDLNEQKPKSFFDKLVDGLDEIIMSIKKWFD